MQGPATQTTNQAGILMNQALPTNPGVGLSPPVPASLLSKIAFLSSSTSPSNDSSSAYLQSLSERLSSLPSQGPGPALDFEDIVSSEFPSNEDGEGEWGIRYRKDEGTKKEASRVAGLIVAHALTPATPFEDLQFQKGDASLRGAWRWDVEGGATLKAKERDSRISMYGWNRLSDMLGEGMCVYDTIEPSDVFQRELGDCYFLSALSALAEDPNRVKRLLTRKEASPNCKYIVNMFNEGEWRKIQLDDYVPSIDLGRGPEPVFNCTKSNEIWAILLEKAWAKLHGSYMAIEAGLSEEAFVALTGAPVRGMRIGNSQYAVSPEHVWKTLLYGEFMNHIMCAGTTQGAEMTPNGIETGLVEGHAYSLLAAYELDQNGNLLENKGISQRNNTTKLVLLRNPHGNNGEWRLNWSDGSKELTDQICKNLNYDKSIDDGTFLMQFDHFLQFFDHISLCMITQGNVNSSMKVETDTTKVNVIKLEIPSDGKYYFTLHQRSRRYFNKDYKYKKCSYVLLRQDEQGSQNGDIYAVEYHRTGEADSFNSCQLKKGIYYAYVK